ncbi:MAG: hypothetical protein K6G17_09040 [Oscillospiraceae bacterium]|nr:hypothetical protein [Oscillospiraceae bacterium]
MFCPNCGKETQGRFCNYCGTPLPAETPAPAPAPEPEKPRKTGKKILTIALIVLLVAALGVGGFFFLRQRKIVKTRQLTSASVDYIIGSQKDKPIRLEKWDPIQEKYVTQYEYSYDKDGCLLKQTLFISVDEDNPKNRRFREDKYHYNDKGEMDSCIRTAYTVYEGEKMVENTWKMQYSYDSKLRLKSTKTYHEGELTLTTKFFYEDGQLDRTEQIGAEGTRITTTDMAFTYDDDQLYSIEYVMVRDGEEMSRYTNRYVCDDDRIEGVKGDEEIKLAARYVYDD